MQTELKTVSSRAEVTKRGTLFCLLEIESITNNQVIPGGFLVPEGTSRVRIREEDLEKVLSLVEPEPSAISRARDRMEAKRRAFINDKLGALTGKDREEAEDVLNEQYIDSVNANFRELMFRDMLPFLSVKPLESGLASPDDAERMAQEAAQALNFQKSMQSAGVGPAAAGGMTAADVMKLVADALSAQEAKIQERVESAVAQAIEEDRATRPSTKK